MSAGWRGTLKPLATVTTALAATLALATLTAQQAQAATTTITVSGTGTGRVFNGIGAISGGGGNTRLLTNYPATQQSQILDYLFKPGYGAALQILKVEIGGDTNSTDGSESSHEHTSGTIDCNTGYEWWLMQQAQARNPNIKFYGLAWGAPGWIGGGTFFSTDMINYIVAWLNCAKSKGLTITYLGGWNERGYNISWYEQLRSTLNADGFGAVQIVGDDTNWNIANDLVSNSAFSSAVQVVGAHYPCGYLSNESTCNSTANAVATGKPLFASENGSQDFNAGAAAMARADNRDYIDGKMTGTINWPIVAAIYPDLPFNTDGLIVANQPWSGNYSVGKQAWVTAQTTQFTAPGWSYIDSATGYLQGNRADGSYVTLKSTNGTDWSSIIETMDATAAQTVTFNVTGGLSTGTVHVWSTNVSSASPSTWFVHSTDITPAGGSFSFTAQPGMVYSLTTTTGQGKGTAASPGPGTLTLPFTDNFDNDTIDQQPPLLSQMQGDFEVENCVAGHTGRCLQQQAATKPIEWDNNANPYTIGGNLSWANYTVSADADIRQAGAVQLLGRVGTQTGFSPADLNAYYFQVSNTGAWSIFRNNTSGTITTLASGTTTALGTGTWHHLSMTLNGSTISGAVDGTTVGTVTDSTFHGGMIGLGENGYQTDQFDNLSVTLVGSATPTGTIVAGDNLAKCVDDNSGSTANGTKIEMWDCNNTGAQNFTMNSNGTIGFGGSCLDITGAATANGTLVELWTCNGGANQQWLPVNGELINPVSGRCLDDPAFTTTNGTQLDIWDCNGGSNQQWAVP